MTDKNETSEYFRMLSKDDLRQAEATTPQVSSSVAGWIFWLTLGGWMLLLEILAPVEGTWWVAPLTRVAVVVPAALWVLADARARDWPFDRVLFYSLWSLFLPEIFVLIYLVRSRSWRGVLASIARFGLYLLIWLAALIAFLWLGEAFGLPVKLD